MSVTTIERGRFANDDERRKALLERQRKPLSAEERIASLEAALAAKSLDYDHFTQLKRMHDTLAKMLREQYAREILSGAPQHQKDLTTAVLFYLRRERRMPRLLRWILDL